MVNRLSNRLPLNIDETNYIIFHPYNQIKFILPHSLPTKVQY